jgi:hypothetical protein
MTADHQLALWMAHPVLETTVAVVMLRKGLHRHFPAFFSYIAFEVASFCLLFPLHRWGSYPAYFYTYWICSAIDLAIGFMVIHEVFLDVFRPYCTLKDLGNVMFKWAALVMLLVAFVVAASSSGQGMEPILVAITTVQRCVRVAQCGLVLFLVVFSSYLGVSWRQQSFGIALGLGGTACVELATYALFAGGPMSQVTLTAINLASYNLALLVWFGYMLADSPARTRQANLFTPYRWERSLSDLQNPAHDDSLIPMFESMVDRALSRTQDDYAGKKTARQPAPEPAVAAAGGLRVVARPR